MYISEVLAISVKSLEFIRSFPVNLASSHQNLAANAGAHLFQPSIANWFNICAYFQRQLIILNGPA